MCVFFPVFLHFQEHATETKPKLHSVLRRELNFRVCSECVVSSYRIRYSKSHTLLQLQIWYYEFLFHIIKQTSVYFLRHVLSQSFFLIFYLYFQQQPHRLWGRGRVWGLSNGRRTVGNIQWWKVTSTMLLDFPNLRWQITEYFQILATLFLIIAL